MADSSPLIGGTFAYARRFDVMSIPTLLVFADGEVKKRLVGAKGKAQLLEELAEFIA